MTQHDPAEPGHPGTRPGDRPGNPTPAPTGTGGPGPTPGGPDGRDPDRRGAPGRASTGGNTPEDGSAPGDVDGDVAAVDVEPGTESRSTTGKSGPAGVAPEIDPASLAAADALRNATERDGIPPNPAAPAEPAEEDAPAAPAPAEEPDWKDRYLRSVAELDNVRKRARRDVALGEARGISRLAKELLPALDNLDRALAHVGAESADAPSHDAQLVEGLRIVHREIHGALSAAGIEAFDPLGEAFDPNFHEALTQQPAGEGTLPGTIVTVYQAGYRRGDDVLRAAKVVVAG
jgi:molecular chaperone GrpE